MSGRRFHVLPSDVSATELVLRALEAHHARRVLRLPVGARVVCFDGRGAAWDCEITAYERDQARAAPLVRLPDEPERPPRVTLAQGIVKGERMDWIVQKATELGVVRIVPLLADRSVVRAEADRRAERWQRIALEAAKQCERNRLPDIDAPTSLADVLAALDGAALAFVERDGAPARVGIEALGRPERVTLFVGPEGGWSPEERLAFERAGVARASLGPDVLRSETAAISAVSVVKYALS